MSDDGYVETEARIVLMKHRRYRVTKSNYHDIYTLWYGGCILKIGTREEVMDRFKLAIDELKGIAA